LIAFDIAAGEERKGVVRFNLDGKVHIGARQIEAPLSLAHKSALQQSGDESRIDLKRGFRVTQREVRFRTAQIQPRAAGVGFQPIIRWTRRIIDHRCAGRLDLVGRAATTVFQFPRAGPARCHGKRGNQQ
jgi:hypothetical protein